MKSKSSRYVLVMTVVLIVLVTQQAWCANANQNHFATTLSGAVMPFVIAGELSLVPYGVMGNQEAIQGAKALLATSFATQALKFAVREKRPNSDSLSSFPSGHTSEAFAMATVLAQYRPNLKWEAYGLATAIGWSRVAAGEHHWQDVAAGALLGHFIAKHYANNHISISPTGIGYNWKF